MKLSLKKVAISLLLPVIAFSAVLINPTSTYALDCTGGTIAEGSECVKVEGMPSCLFGSGCAFNNVINTVLFLLGATSVVMLIYGGIRYTLSGGNSSSVTAAKNTILYAVIGLVVALLAFSISNFVIMAIK